MKRWAHVMINGTAVEVMADSEETVRKLAEELEKLGVDVKTVTEGMCG